MYRRRIKETRLRSLPYLIMKVLGCFMAALGFLGLYTEEAANFLPVLHSSLISSLLLVCGIMVCGWALTQLIQTFRALIVLSRKQNNLR